MNGNFAKCSQIQIQFGDHDLKRIIDHMLPQCQCQWLDDRAHRTEWYHVIRYGIGS